MSPLLEFALLAFSSLFTTVDPLGVMPIYMTMLDELDEAEARQMARRAVLVATLTLVLFAFAGRLIFGFFGISVNGLRIVGGVIFFVIGYDMLQAHVSRTKHDEESTTEYARDMAITPLGIPMIAGPGAITAVLVLMQDAANVVQQGVLMLTIAAVMGITLAMMFSGKRILAFLGDSGTKVLMRLMGLIIMVVAVEFFFAGVTPFVQEMLMLEP